MAPRIRASFRGLHVLILAGAFFADLACGGPDFVTAPDRSVTVDAGVDVDNSPIVCKHCDDQTATDAADERSDAANTATFDAGSESTVSDAAGTKDSGGDDGSHVTGNDGGDATMQGAPDAATGADDASMADALATPESGHGSDGAEASSCTDMCTEGLTECTSNGVQSCQRGGDGCTHWATTSTCGAHQSCTAASGSPICACNASVCTQSGAVCQDSETVVTCATDPDGCPYVASTSPCTMPETCSGMAPNAMCALTCSNSCSQGQTSCVSGGLATCALGGNGCWAYDTPVACGSSRQSCTGTSGAATCMCNADPVCIATGLTCTNQSTLTTCAQDPQGCFYQSMSSQCMNGNQCISGGCSCPTGTHDCSGTCKSNTSVDSCGTACTSTCPGPSNGSSYGNASCDGTSCGLTCISGYSVCSGACVNEQTDANNCGACGHACAVSSCVIGVCQAVELASAPNGSIEGIGIDSTSIYFTTGITGAIAKCPLSGCGMNPGAVAPTIVTGLSFAGGLFYDMANSVLFVTTENAGTVYSYSTSGTMNWSITGQSNVYWVTADSTWVYWTTYTTPQNGVIQRASRSNGTGTTTFLSSPSLSFTAPWYDAASNAIYASGVGTGASSTLERCTPSGQCTSAVVPYPVTNIVSVYGSTVYFGNRGTAAGNFMDGGVYSAPISNLANVTPIATGGNYSQPNAIAADANYVYFSTLAGFLYRCSVTGCGNNPTQIAPGSTSPLVYNSQALYWGSGSYLYMFTK